MRFVLTVALLGLSLAVATPASAEAFDGVGLCKKKKRKKARRRPPKKSARGKSSKSVDRTWLDASLTLLAEGRHEDAAITLHGELGGIDGSLRPEARYAFGRALYKLGFYYSALDEFGAALADSRAGLNLRTLAMEWALFALRRVEGKDRLLSRLEAVDASEFPERYAAEYRYELARHLYLGALRAEQSGEALVLGEPRSEASAAGGTSFSGDIFGDDDSGASDDDGLSFGGDLFGAEETEEEGDGLSLGDDVFSEEAAAPTEDPRFGRVSALLGGIPAGSRLEARARFLQGVMLYRNRRENEALEAFKSVVRLTKKGAPQEDAALRQLAFFQLARTHFGAKQPSFSNYYYAKMPRFTEAWLTALYESSWAHFRLGRYERALGNLLTLHSPFFDDFYFPESHILKAVSYYENCRYAQARDILKDFREQYRPVFESLESLIRTAKTPAAYQEMLENLREEDTAEAADNALQVERLGQLLNIALADPVVARADAVFKEVEAEIVSIRDWPGFQERPIKTYLIDRLTSKNEEQKTEIGEAVRLKLEFEYKALRALLEQEVRIRIETAAAEQRRIEATLRNVDSRSKRDEREHVGWADDESLVWPFDGEYWRDELGTYELTLVETCL